MEEEEEEKKVVVVVVKVFKYTGELHLTFVLITFLTCSNYLYYYYYYIIFDLYIWEVREINGK